MSEVATEMNMPSGTVLSMVHRMRKRLSHKLDEPRREVLL